MRKFNKKQKIAAAGVTVVVAIAGAGAGYAYWSTNGSGQGGATTAADSGKSVTIESASSITNLTPGGKAQALDLTIRNQAATSQSLRGITVALQSISKDGTVVTNASVCSADDFVITQPAPPTDATTGTVGWVVPAKTAAGAGTATATGATIALKDDPNRNQDGCKAVGLNLTYTGF
jgi:hypothetical protein